MEVFQPNFRRNFIHIQDVVSAFIFAINNFNKLKNNIYNLGLSSANLTKLNLAKKIRNYQRDLTIKISNTKSDPDKRDYYVSNKKIIYLFIVGYCVCLFVEFVNFAVAYDDQLIIFSLI